MEKLVSRLRKKFQADPLINWVDMSMPEGNGNPVPFILDVLEKDTDRKYVIKTLPVVRRLYEEAVEKNSEKVAVKIRKDHCQHCDAITQMEVIAENGNFWGCFCLTCKGLNEFEIEPKEDAVGDLDAE